MEVYNKQFTQNMSIIAEFDFNDMTCIIIYNYIDKFI